MQTKREKTDDIYPKIYAISIICVRITALVT